MPQMAPLSWLSLLFYFMVIFMLVNSLNFYSFMYQNKTSQITKKTDVKLNWKWL
uniref:ATP synthase F0 subunit 8 n=1 Tax=Lagorina sericea TaxID=2908302 RepID=UPI001FA74DFD|nr:ATP synthase F0 subunit 8 [Lagorina sericea]UMR54876.1 ATP synthase F0 subunit 8 [Lagorina sericea]